MKVTTHFPVKTLAGTVPGKDPITLQMHKGIQVARKKPTYSQQATSSQSVIRTWFRDAARSWNSLAQVYVETWNEFAEENPERIGDVLFKHSGQTWWTRTQFYRFMNNLPITNLIPDNKPFFYAADLTSPEYYQAGSVLILQLRIDQPFPQTGYFLFKISCLFDHPGRRAKLSEYRCLPDVLHKPVLKLKRSPGWWQYSLYYSNWDAIDGSWVWFQVIPISNRYWPGPAQFFQRQLLVEPPPP